MALFLEQRGVVDGQPKTARTRCHAGDFPLDYDLTISIEEARAVARQSSLEKLGDRPYALRVLSDRDLENGL
jgi:hypothetical protein